MFMTKHNIENVGAHLGSALARMLMAAALGIAIAPAAFAANDPDRSVPPPAPPTLTVSSATVSFPLGNIPSNVTRSANASVSEDGKNALFTGGLGPITAEAYSTSAPAGINFRMDGTIVSPVTAGTAMQFGWEVVVEFTGGSVNWGLAGNANVPTAGTQFTSQNGSIQLSNPLGPRTVTFTSNRTFVANGSSNGSFSTEFSLSWVGFIAGDSLKVTVNRMYYAIPSPGVASVFAAAGLMAIPRRRSRN